MKQEQPPPKTPQLLARTALFIWAVWCCLFVSPSPLQASTPQPVPTITLALGDTAMAPYYQVSEDKTEIYGMWPKMLNGLFVKELGWNIRYLIRPWQRAQHEVRTGNADGFLTIKTPEREKYTTSIPTPFCCFPLHLYTWKGHPRIDEMRTITTLDDLVVKKFSLVSNIGNGWFKTNVEERGVKTQWLPEDQHVIKFVAMKRGDGFIDLPSSIQKQINELNLQDKVVDTEVTFGPIYVQLMLNKKSAFAGRSEEINQAMKKLSEDGTFSRICLSAQQKAMSPGSKCLCGHGQSR